MQGWHRAACTDTTVVRYGFNNVYTAHDIHAWQPSSWPFSSPQGSVLASVRVGGVQERSPLVVY